MPSTTTISVLLRPHGAPVHPGTSDLDALNTRFEDAHPVAVIRWAGSGKTDRGLHL